jgi:hypothetical protein
VDISFSDVRRDIGEYFDDLQNLARSAVQTYRAKYSAEVHVEHSKRSRASCVHDHFVAAAARFAEQHSGVELVPSQSLWMLCFEKGYAVCFKKLDDDKLPRGHLTGQAVRFRNQLPIDNLPIPEAKKLFLGYQRNDLGELYKVYLTCPSGNTANQWAEELDEDGIGSSVIVNLFDPAPTEDQGGRIVPKKPKEDDEAESGNGDPGP